MTDTGTDPVAVVIGLTGFAIFGMSVALGMVELFAWSYRDIHPAVAYSIAVLVGSSMVGIGMKIDEITSGETDA